MKTTIVNKPWGRFEQFTLNQPSTVKIITVNKDARLSLQVHNQRDELWVALDPGLKAEIGNSTVLLDPGNTVKIYRGQSHRVTSTLQTARFLEISFGHFDESDIIRLEDDYGRENLPS